MATSADAEAARYLNHLLCDQVRRGHRQLLVLVALSQFSAVGFGVLAAWHATL